MKRLFAAMLALLLLLGGCGMEDAAAPSPGSPLRISVLEEFRDFGSFTAGKPRDAAGARLLVESVLAQYPPGFAAQWGSVEILLVGGLTGTDAFVGGRYAGFTQQEDDGWLMVLDAGRCDAGTVHHEIAHILDGILTEAGALTEEAWMGFCPSGFQYGGDWETCADFFADDYAMTDIREDRARTFEEAALLGPGVYADRPALWLKLDCFSRAIREHFDTDGWQEKPFWELALE